MVQTHPEGKVEHCYNSDGVYVGEIFGTKDLFEKAGYKVVEGPTLEDQSAVEGRERSFLIKQKAGQIISQIVSPTTSANMSAAYNVGFMDEEQIASYRECISWIFSVQVFCREAIKDQDKDFQDDMWPKPSSRTLDFVKTY